MALRSTTDNDPLDSLLSLEDQYYQEGYDLGLSDGTRAGRIEGRLFGLQKGTEKHLELGRLSGKATIWSARLNPGPNPNLGRNETADMQIVPLQASERLRKHITRLCDLTDPSTLSTENSEDAVEEFESRLKDARLKTVLISKSVGEGDKLSKSNDGRSKSQSPGSQGVKPNGLSYGVNGGEMEDFVGVVPISKSKVKADEEGER